MQLFCNFLFSEALGDDPKTLDFIGISGIMEEVFNSYGPEGQGFESLRGDATDKAASFCYTRKRPHAGQEGDP